MSKQLFFQAVSKFLLGSLLVGLLVFLPAGTPAFWNGWLLMGVLFIPMFFAGIVMMIKSPELLKKRLSVKEKLGEQKRVLAFSALMFLLGFVLAGLDFRFKWTRLPAGIPIASAVLFLIGYALYAEVLRENAYLSRTIEVQDGQRVIDTGLYGIVRHPMYSATIIIFLAMPLVLGSLVSFAAFLAYPFIIAGRIRSEEAFLERELQGYSAYREKVKYRLIPFLW